MAVTVHLGLQDVRKSDQAQRRSIPRSPPYEEERFLCVGKASECRRYRDEWQK